MLGRLHWGRKGRKAAVRMQAAMGAPRKEVCSTRAQEKGREALPAGILLRKQPPPCFFCCTAPRRGQCQQSCYSSKGSPCKELNRDALPTKINGTTCQHPQNYMITLRPQQQGQEQDPGRWAPLCPASAHLSFLLSPHFSNFHKIQAWHLISVGLYRCCRYSTTEGASFICASACKTHLKRAAERIPVAHGYCSPRTAVSMSGYHKRAGG